jgi:hypothetical protein
MFSVKERIHMGTALEFLFNSDVLADNMGIEIPHAPQRKTTAPAIPAMAQTIVVGHASSSIFPLRNQPEVKMIFTT